MKIHNCRPVAHRGAGRFRDVAIFDAEVVDGLVLLGLKLALAPDWRRFVFAPEVRGQRFARLNGDYARRLADAAFVAMRGGVAHDYST